MAKREARALPPTSSSASSRDLKRAGEQGLSLIEALVIVTITALLALLLLPMVSRAAGRNFSLAEHALDSAEAANAEQEFRALMSAALPGGFSGRADSLMLTPSSPSPLACVREGAPGVVRVRIADAARLVCEGAGHSRDLLAWGSGEARLAYSADGRAWSTLWTEDEGAPLVKFELLLADGRALAWIARAGALEAEAP